MNPFKVKLLLNTKIRKEYHISWDGEVCDFIAYT